MKNFDSSNSFAWVAHLFRKMFYCVIFTIVFDIVFIGCFLIQMGFHNSILKSILLQKEISPAHVTLIVLQIASLLSITLFHLPFYFIDSYQNPETMTRQMIFWILDILVSSIAILLLIIQAFKATSEQTFMNGVWVLTFYLQIFVFYFRLNSLGFKLTHYLKRPTFLYGL